MNTSNDLETIRKAIGLKKQELSASPLPAGVIPIEIHCHWSACAHGRHSLDHYQRVRRGSQKYPPGHCQDCGEKVADLPSDGDVMPFDDNQFFATFAAFPKELIRAHYWNVRFDLRAYHQAFRYGRLNLMAKVRADVIKVMTDTGPFSRRGAPYSEKIVAYAQHATGTCCRGCASYWHGVPRSGVPTDEQLEYLVRMAQSYLELRLPGLPEEPTPRVPKVAKFAGPDDEEMLLMENDIFAAFARDVDPAGLVLPQRSRLRLVDRRDSVGGWIEPIVELDMPPVAQVG